MVEVAIIGAGPYGLSIGAYFRRSGIPFRIFGRVMDSWISHMPKGMCLKSEGFASNIYDPNGEFTLKHFCAEQGIDYYPSGKPVRLATFSSYGRAFKERMVPELEEKLVIGLDCLHNGFRLVLDDGEVVKARRVVLAVGITHFEHIPTNLSNLSLEYLSHSFRHCDLESFRGRSVTVLGGGSSATDLAGLLHEVNADVQLVARQATLKFHGMPQNGGSLWQRIRRPQSGIGPGWRLRFCAEAPMAFHHLPEKLRLEALRRVLGPAGGWFTKEKVIGRVPLVMGYTVNRADVREGKVSLSLISSNGAKREILTEHVIAATGYKVAIDRLKFVSEEIRSKLRTVNGAPVLSPTFESSIPRLYFVGVSAAYSFGPVMRFAFGAGFAAKTVTRTILGSLSSKPATISVPGLLSSTE